MALTESEELELLELEEQEAMAQSSGTMPSSTDSDLASTLYHGAIAGGAMTLGGAAGAVLGAPAGPIGSVVGGTALAAAMYPPAKRFAEGIDRMRGITPDLQQNPATEFGQGLAIEAGGKALGPIAKGIGKVLPGSKIGEMVSGHPRQGLSRAYKQGFKKTYIDPKPLGEASKNFGDAKFAMIGKTITPEEQVSMMVNPAGQANQKVADVMTKWIKGEPITAQEALAARQGADTIFPADVAKRQAQRGGLSEFKTAMNEIIVKENPEFAKANKDFAASKLRSQLLKPARVNKSNPDQYSKLGGMFNAMGLAGGAATGFIGPAIAATLGASPLAMGTISSIAGSTARAGIPESVRRAALAAFIDKFTTKGY